MERPLADERPLTPSFFLTNPVLFVFRDWTHTYSSGERKLACWPAFMAHPLTLPLSKNAMMPPDNPTLTTK
jgi:hypothetical protein